jgi:hypothetical protein
MIVIGVGMGLQNAIVFKLVPHYVPGAVGGASGWVGGLGAFNGFLLPVIMGIVAGAVGGEVGYARAFLALTAMVALGLVVVGWLTRWSWQTELGPRAGAATPTVAFTQSPTALWRALCRPELWYAGYQQTLSRSADFPATGSSGRFVFRTRIDEEVAVRVERSEPYALLEERHEGRTFSRHLLYRIEQDDGASGARLTVEDAIHFKGVAKLAAPLAASDARRRWKPSFDRLQAAVELAADRAPGPPSAGT